MEGRASMKNAMKNDWFEDDARQLVNSLGDETKLTVNQVSVITGVWRISPFKGFPCCSAVSHVSDIC